jgi:hypothetical protein
MTGKGFVFIEYPEMDSMDSYFRRNDGLLGIFGIAGFSLSQQWIPAFAGMTACWGFLVLPAFRSCKQWIPAFGMTGKG